MIFSNEGQTQIAGTPEENIREITWIIRTLRERYQAEDEGFVDKMLIIGGRISMLNEEEEAEFHMSLNGQSMSVDDLITYLEDFLVEKRGK